MNPATERSHAPLVEEETEPTSAHYRSDDTDETLPLLPTVCAFLVVLSAALFQWAATAGVSSSSYEVAALVALVCAVGVHFLGAQRSSQRSAPEPDGVTVNRAPTTAQH